MLTIQLLALALALALVTGTNLPSSQSWSGEDLLLQPNSTSRNFSLAAALELDSGSSPSAKTVSQDLVSQDLLPQDLIPQTNRCNITVLRLVTTSLLARWERSLGFNCDVLLFTTNSKSRSSFSAAFSRVFPPVIIDHVGVGGGQQEFKLCVGCGGTRRRRSGRRRTSEQGQQVSFCCLDFSLEELSWDTGWRLNRKPIESTLVACFMTMVIIIWSVAALIWPVPIIAGFLPNGMEQRRG